MITENNSLLYANLLARDNGKSQKLSSGHIDFRTILFTFPGLLTRKTRPDLGIAEDRTLHGGGGREDSPSP